MSMGRVLCWALPALVHQQLCLHHHHLPTNSQWMPWVQQPCGYFLPLATSPLGCGHHACTCTCRQGQPHGFYLPRIPPCPVPLCVLVAVVLPEGPLLWLFVETILGRLGCALLPIARLVWCSSSLGY